MRRTVPGRIPSGTLLPVTFCAQVQQVHAAVAQEPEGVAPVGAALRNRSLAATPFGLFNAADVAGPLSPE